MTTVTRPVQVEVWSDPQCVWCFIAHQRFQKAVAAFDGQVEVTYRSFELRPGVPTEIDKELQIARHAGAAPRRVEAWTPEDAREVLIDRRYRVAVDLDSDRLRALGASGVPLHVVDGKWGISGAQPVHVYLEALQRSVEA